MKPLNQRSIQLRALLKEQLRKKRLSYPEVAKELNVSLPTIKRWMTKDDIPFQYLDALLGFLELPWDEAMSHIEKPTPKRSVVSSRQELYLSKHAKNAYALLLLFRGYSFEQIVKRLGISTAELEKIFLELDRNDLVVYSGRHSVRPLIKGPFRWKADGPFSKRYFSVLLAELFDRIRRQHTGFSNTPGKDSFLRQGEMYLSKKSFAKMKLDIWELVEKYRATAQTEARFMSGEDLFPTAHLFFLDDFDLWKSVMWEK